ncbi:MAG: FG-GAP-like repeat-containing protein, partial [Planctomycetota bacterium]|nr:FG-GAP-like repeat-containing protein [Planctomycetota bacterium]
MDTGGLTLAHVRDTTYRIEGLAALTGDDGAYRLSIAEGCVRDLGGNLSTGSQTVEWTRAAAAPAVLAILDAPSGAVTATPGSVYVKFSQPIAAATFEWSDLALTRSGGANLIGAGDVAIAPAAADLYRVSGLDLLAAGDGSYVLTVNAAGVRNAAGTAGVGQGRAAWTIDATGPAVGRFEGLPGGPTNRALDVVDVVFSEPIDAGTFDRADLVLSRQGGPNLIAPGVTVTRLAAAACRIAGLGALTGTDGLYELRINLAGIRDSLGNKGTGEAAAFWTADMTPPPAPIALAVAPDSGFSNTDWRTNTAAVALTGELAEPGLSVVLFDETLGWKMGAAQVAGTAFALAVTFPTAGVHNIRLTLTDAAGNATLAVMSLFVDVAQPTVTRIEPLAPVTQRPTASIDVVFSEPIDPASFDLADLVLTRNGSGVPIAAAGAGAATAGIRTAAGPTITPLSATVFRVGGLEGVTAQLGRYELTVDMAGVCDLAGNAGFGTLGASWDVVPDTDPPTVERVIVQNGQVQRSTVNTLRAVFSEPMALGDLVADGRIAAAVTLKNLGLNADRDPDAACVLSAGQFAYDAAANALAWSLDGFAGTPASLEDGYYEWRILAARASDLAGLALDGDADGTPGGDFVYHFGVCRGDVTGDGAVGADDLERVTRLLGWSAGEPQWDPEADLNHDGRISTRDRLVCYQAMGRAVVPPDTVRPTVVAASIQNGLTERGYVDTLTITFSEAVNVPALIADGRIASAVTLTNLGADADRDPDQAVALSAGQFAYDEATHTLAWSLDAFAGGRASLADGYYELRLDPALLADLVGNPLAPAGATVIVPDLQAVRFVRAAGADIRVNAYSVPALMDWNGDGLPDLIVGEQTAAGGKIRLYLNEGAPGAPAFSAFAYVRAGGGDLAVPSAGCLGVFPRAFDWNEDGLADLVLGLADGRITVYLNSGAAGNPAFGAGQFIQVGQPAAKVDLDVGDRAALDLADWDADGRWDLIAGALDGQVRAYLNEGAAGAPEFRTAAF